MPASIIIPYIAAAFGVTAGTFAFAALSFGVRLVTSFVVSSILSNRGGAGGGGQGSGAQLGNRVQLPPSTDNKIPVVYGRAYMKPIITDAKISEDNQTMWYVLTFSEAMDNSTANPTTFGDMYWAGRKLNFDGTDQTRVVSWTDPTGETDTKVDGKIFVWKYKDGSLTPLNASGAANYAYGSNVLADTSIAAAQRWTSAKKMTKLTFAVIKVIYDQEAGLTGLGEITAEIRNDNVRAPGTVIKDYLTNTRYGPSFSTATVNTSTLALLDTYSTETITYLTTASTTATVARYQINGPIDTSKNFLENLNGLVDACDSWLQWNETTSQWGVVINRDVSTSSMTLITSDNIIGGVNIQPVDLNSAFNAVDVQYANDKARDQTGHWYQEIEYYGIERAANEPINVLSLTLPYTNNIIQAQYLGGRRLLLGREDLTISFTMDYSGIQIDAGDVITINHDRYGWTAGTFYDASGTYYTGKPFRVNQVQEAKSDDGTLYAKISASEYNATVYTNSLEGLEDFELSLNTGITDPGTVSAPSQPVISNIFTTTTVPSFDVSTVVGALGAVQGVEFWYGSTSTVNSTWQIYVTELPSTTFYNSGTSVVSNITGLPAGTYYLSTRSVTARTKSAFSTVSNALIWTPLSQAGQANTSTNSDNILHRQAPNELSTANLPLALSTTTAFSPINNTSTLFYNVGRSELNLVNSMQSGNFTMTSQGSVLNFSGTGTRFTAVMSGTGIDRFAFQNNQANSLTGLYVLPSGTAQVSSVNLFTNSNPTNASRITLAAVGNLGASSYVGLDSAVAGTGTQLPMVFLTNGIARVILGANTGITQITTNTNATSTTTGALIVTGGTGMRGNLHVGGELTLEGTQWIAYSPTWSGSGTAPTIGNGTIAGRYKKVGKTVFLNVKLTMGSTSTFGTGVWNFTLPSGLPAQSGSSVVMASVYEDISGPAYNTGVVTNEYDASTALVTALTHNATVSATVPFTWTTGDVLLFNGSYETA